MQEEIYTHFLPTFGKQEGIYHQVCTSQKYVKFTTKEFLSSEINM